MCMCICGYVTMSAPELECNILLLPQPMSYENWVGPAVALPQVYFVSASQFEAEGIRHMVILSRSPCWLFRLATCEVHVINYFLTNYFEACTLNSAH